MKLKNKFIISMFLLSLIAAIITFFILLNIEKKYLEREETTWIWVNQNRIEQNQIITRDDLISSFKQMEVPISCSPSNRIIDLNELINQKAKIEIVEGTLLTAPMFYYPNEVVNSIENPVLVGCKANDIAEFANGIIRSGDFIDIYIFDHVM